MFLRTLACISLAILLSGCNSTPKSAFNTPFVTPLAADIRTEIQIARLSDVLNNTELDAEQQAKFYYNRGTLYDSVGLPTLARIDFNRAVKLKPDLADVYNFLGIHMVLAEDYSKAFEMYDAVIELAPEHEYVYLNRGIAEYYANRPQLAVQDFQRFLARDEDDPYRMLWLYLAARDIDEVKARNELISHKAKLTEPNWANAIVDLYLGAISQDAFIATFTMGDLNPRAKAERFCEGYFYLAKLMQFQGHYDRAAEYFKLALATNVYEFVEHKYAELELKLMAQQQNAQPVGQ